MPQCSQSRTTYAEALRGTIAEYQIGLTFIEKNMIRPRVDMKPSFFRFKYETN